MKKVFSLLSSPHLPCCFSFPSGHLLLEISLQLLPAAVPVVYFFQVAKYKNKCCRWGLFPRTGKSLIPPWISFPGSIAPINSPTPPPSPFQVPPRPRTLKGGDRIRDPDKTAMTPYQHDTLSHLLLQTHTLCTLSPQGARMLGPWFSETTHSMFPLSGFHELKHNGPQGCLECVIQYAEFCQSISSL